MNPSEFEALFAAQRVADTGVLDLSAYSHAVFNYDAARWEIRGEPVDDYRTGSYFEALDALFAAVVAGREMPASLAVIKPGGGRVVLWGASMGNLQPSEAESATLTFQLYRDPEGSPTCCAHVDDRACHFLACTHFGQRWECTFPGPSMGTVRDDGAGYLRPSNACPLWKDRT